MIKKFKLKNYVYNLKIRFKLLEPAFCNNQPSIKKIRNQLFTIFKSISCSTITIYKNYLFADDYKSNLRFVKRLWQKQG